MRNSITWLTDKQSYKLASSEEEGEMQMRKRAQNARATGHNSSGSSYIRVLQLVCRAARSEPTRR